MKLATGQNIGKEICDVLGLKHCNLLDIHIEKDSFVTVTARFNPEVDGVMQFPAILKKFQLVEIEEKKDDLTGEYGLDGPNDEKVTWEQYAAKRGVA